MGVPWSTLPGPVVRLSDAVRLPARLDARSARPGALRQCTSAWCLATISRQHVDGLWPGHLRHHRGQRRRLSVKCATVRHGEHAGLVLGAPDDAGRADELRHAFRDHQPRARRTPADLSLGETGHRDPPEGRRAFWLGRRRILILLLTIRSDRARAWRPRAAQPAGARPDGDHWLRVRRDRRKPRDGSSTRSRPAGAN